jgi:predicted alpha/beta superfamily hydrolase
MDGGNRDTSQHYPVVYLLDGDAHFGSVAGNDPATESDKWQHDLPGDDRRWYSKYRPYRDLTPTHINSDPQ